MNDPACTEQGLLSARNYLGGPSALNALRQPESSGLLPNLIIGGVPKSGTSSLFRWLSDHPDVLGSTCKETYFFCDPGTHMYQRTRSFEAGIDAYRQFFPRPRGPSPKIVVEATPSYVYSKIALEQIPQLPSEPKLIFLLREPASQIYSLYSYFSNNWSWIPKGMSFSEFVEIAKTRKGDFRGNELAANALHFADYRPYLEAWEERLGADRMRVWLFDDLIENKVGLTKRVAEFCELPTDFYDTYQYPRDNETYAVRNHWLQQLNISIRNQLPKGRIYEVCRTLYRRINTQRPAGPKSEDEECLSALREEFKTPNSQLAERFQLDLTAWQQS